MDKDPDDPPITIEKVPNTEHFKLLLNRQSRLLSEAKRLRAVEEEAAVAFVFKYGLALTVMGLLDAMKKTPDWATNAAGCRDRIQHITGYISTLVDRQGLAIVVN